MNVEKLKDAWAVLTGRVCVRSARVAGNDDVPVIWQDAVATPYSSPGMAMKLAAVYRCASIVSGSVASLPLLAKRRGADGVWHTIEGGPLDVRLRLRPNDRQTRFDLVRGAVLEMLFRGNAYLWPEWDATGELRRLVLLTPGSCSYDKEANRYTVSDFTNHVYGTFGPDEVIHLRNLSTDGGYTGVSTLAYASKVLGIAARSDDKSEEVFSPGGTRRGFVTGGSEFTRGVGLFQDEEVKNSADRVERELQSGKKVITLAGGTDFKPMDLSPADTQLLGNKQFGVLEVCRFFGVHPDKVFAGQSTNYKASEMSQVLFMSDTLQQILQQFSLEFTAKLFTPSQYGRYKVEFGIEDFYNTDLVTLATVTEKNIGSGIWTVNEARRRRGYPPVAGGDDVLVSANLMPVGWKKSATKDARGAEMQEP